MSTPVDLELVAKLQNAQTDVVAAQVMKDALQRFGYQTFHYGLIPLDAKDPGGEFISMNMRGAEWEHFYHENALHRTDYTVIHCRKKRTSPLIWSDVWDLADRGGMPAPMVKTTQMARDWGWGQGLTAPLRTVGPYAAGIGISCDPVVSRREHSRAFSAQRTEILTLLDCFHAHVNRRRLGVDFYRLSPREIEILKWLADGKRVKTIAHKLGTSIHTVDKQIRSAKRRLRAATSQQAVVKAFALNIVDW